MTNEEQKERPTPPLFRPLNRPSSDSGRSSPRRRSERSIKHHAESDHESEGTHDEKDALISSEPDEDDDNGAVTKV